MGSYWTCTDGSYLKCLLLQSFPLVQMCKEEVMSEDLAVRTLSHLHSALMHVRCTRKVTGSDVYKTKKSNLRRKSTAEFS